MFDDPYDYYQVIARASNTCGTSNWISTIDSGGYGYVEIMDCYYFSMYPNPATDYVTVEIKNLCSDDNSSALKSSEVYNIQIIDKSGISHYSGKKSEENFTIPISNLKDGVYYVRISRGKDVLSQPLIIKH